MRLDHGPLVASDRGVPATGGRTMIADVTAWIDTERYPLHAPGTVAYAALVAERRAAFYRDGVCVLDGFMRPAAVERMVAEAASLEGLAWHNTLTGTAYLAPPELDRPPEHPRRRTATTALAAVAYDQIPPEHVLHRVYHWPALTRFIADVVDRGPVYHYACPLGAINVAVMGDGDHLRWHFDQSDFVVSIPIRSAEAGGDFECVRFIRGADDENYPGVSRVLDGDRAGVEVLPTRPGSLIVFRGMHTVHRVTRVEGPTARLVGLLGYAMTPDTTSTDHLRRIRYGRLA